MTDWNWFFSSLAQSAAAIVGIFGAFIITKILSNQSVYSQKSTNLLDLLNQARRLQEDAKDHYFDWYIKRSNERELADVYTIFKTDPNLSAEDYYERLHFPVFFHRTEAVKLIETKIEAIKNSRSPYRADMSAYNPDLTKSLQKERESIDLTLRNIRSHMRSIQAFLTTVRNNPESSQQITCTLLLIIILFFWGVIVPLGFLPITTDNAPRFSLTGLLSLLFSLRGFLLFMVSVIFSSVIVMFYKINRKLKYPSENISSLEDYTRLSTYSKYFAVMEENGKHEATAPGQ